MRARTASLAWVASALVVAGSGFSCTANRTSAGVRVEWDALRPRVVSDWERESPFTYNLESDVDRHGRFVAFLSSVRDGPAGVYLRDMETRAITRLDVWYTGDQPTPGTPADERTFRFGSTSASISANGRYVAFDSGSPYLVHDDGNRASDVFVYDRKTSRLRLVSTDAAGVQGDRASSHPSISAGGRFIAFSSRATNLSAQRTHAAEVYVKDMRTGAIRVVSAGTGAQSLKGRAWSPSISSDGTVVAFVSDAADFVLDDTNRAPDAFVADLSRAEVTRVSVSSNGEQLVPFEYEESASSFRDGVNEVALSGDGRTVAFSTHANGLVPEDRNNNVDIYVHDLEGGTTERVSVTSDGTDAYRDDDRQCGVNGQCFGSIASHSPTMSHDGRYVAFVSGAPLLDPSDVDKQHGSDEDVFVHDRQTGLTVLVNRTYAGKPAPGYNFSAGSISGDGRRISFASDGRLLRNKRGAGENQDVYLQRLPVPFTRH